MSVQNREIPTAARSRSGGFGSAGGRPRRRLGWSWEGCESRTLLTADYLVSIAPAVFVDRPGTGTTLATFEVTLAPANIESQVLVDYTTVDGTATSSGPDPDFVATSGTLTFPVTSTSQEINVEILAQTTDEPNKTFYVDISNARLVPPNGQTVAIANAQSTGTIVNTHFGGQVQFAAANYVVDEAAGTAQVTFTRTGGDASEAGALFTTTTTGTAIPGVDFTPVTTLVTFGYNQTTATVDIPINTQLASTGDLTVGLRLEQPFGGATLGTPATATLTIRTTNPLIVTTTADDGIGSLRYAINYADSTRAPANPVIVFAINAEGPVPHTIAPASPLPAITRPLTIDATTQPGYLNFPVIILSGANLPTEGVTSLANGLVVEAGYSTILGLAIHGFPGSAIVLDGSGSSRVTRNVLGADPTGRFAAPNGNDGVMINGSSGNAIVGNLISGNGNVGVEILNAGATHNLIQGNKIGTDATGSQALPNATDGVFLNGVSQNSVLGNVISGNGNVGVQVYNVGATQNLIRDNKIGTDATGSFAIQNATDGVFLNGSQANIVLENLISGNGSVGVQIFGSAATQNLIQSNKIGTDATGMRAIPNVRDGVFLNSARGNSVLSNLISGNGSVGIQVLGPASSSNVIRGNVIGLNAANRPLGNAYGAYLNGVPSSMMVRGNVIRGNRVAQVYRIVPASTGTSTNSRLTGLSRRLHLKTTSNGPHLHANRRTSIGRKRG